MGQQPTQVIRGTVIDKDIHLPLIGATVVLQGTNPLRGTTTDADGYFRIEEVPTGRYDLQVSYIGYENYFIGQLLVGSGKEVVLTIEMQEAVNKLEEVTVVAADQDKGKPLNEMAAVSALSFSVEETSRYAASLNDPSRMAQSFAGVATAGDKFNEIVVRGNSARGVLWRIEGIEVPNPNHFASGEGSTGGGISILSNAVMANSDFYTGAFPAEYGNALSGVFDINLRRGNNERREYAIQAGILGMQAALEGPFSKKSKASYLLNYRYSTLALLNKMGLEVQKATIVPKYQDLAFNIVIPTSKAGRFSVFGIGGISEGGRLALRDSTQWEVLADRFESAQRRVMGVLGTTYSYLMKNNKTYVKVSAAYSTEDDLYRQDSLDSYYNPVLDYQDNFLNSSARAGVSVNHKFRAGLWFRAGVNYNWLSFRTASRFHQSDSTSYLDQNYGLTTSLIQSYAQLKWKPRASLEIMTGLHHSSFLLNNNHVLEPRFGLRWQFLPTVALSAGMGLHSRMEPISLYANNLTRPLPSAGFVFENGNSFLFSPHSTLRLTQSWHNVIGMEWTPLPNWRLRSEVYYQQLFNVPVSKDSTSTFSTVNYNSFNRDLEIQKGNLVNKGKGYNYGLEVSVERFFADNYYLLFTSSVFESKYLALDGVLRHTRFSQGYVANLLGGKEFPLGTEKQHILGVNFKLVVTGGLRSTPVNFEASQEQGREILYEDQAFSQKLPAYFRPDVGFSYRWNKNRYALITSIDIQNFVNRKNIQTQYFDPRADGIVTVYQMGIIPILNLRLEF